MDSNGVWGGAPMEEKEEKKGPRYSTSCKDCVFARFRGNTQIGCQFDRVEKFKKRGVEVIDCYDEEKEFSVIGTICLLHKHKKSPWAKTHPGRQRKVIARKEIELHVDVALVMQEEHTVEDVRATIEALLAQEVLPSRVTISLNRSGVKVDELTSLLPENWIVQVVKERENGGGRISRGRCIDLAVADSKSPFYAVFTPGFCPPKDFFSSIDRAVNDELEQFVLLTPNQAGEGMVVHHHIHRYVGGNTEAVITDPENPDQEGQRADDVADKVRYLAKKNNMTDMIKPVESVCPSLQTPAA